MNAHILSLSCCNPQLSVSQERIADTLANSLSLTEHERSKLKMIFNNSKINTRHSVIPDYNHEKLEGAFFGSGFPENVPDMAQRNEIYKSEAPKLALQSSLKALERWGGKPSDITHIISVSCTGVYAPGIEFQLIEALGLNPTVERLGINFMGCFGAFKGLAIAKALAKENPKNRVLMVCTELCSLHFQADNSVETFVANALFSDGSAAAIVGCEPRKGEKALFEMVNQSSFALSQTKELMTWEAANTGLVMKVSVKVPAFLGKHIAAFSEQLLGPELPFTQCEWAIHPGGKAIVETIEKACQLTEEQTKAAWKVLEKYGNMSSATFLFILDEIKSRKKLHDWVVGLGFGPGLSIEGILLRAVP